MAKLTQVERRQLRRKTPPVERTARWEVRPLAEYLAFVTFASRLQPARKAGLIGGEKGWKL